MLKLSEILKVIEKNEDNDSITLQEASRLLREFILFQIKSEEFIYIPDSVKDLEKEELKTEAEIKKKNNNNDVVNEINVDVVINIILPKNIAEFDDDTLLSNMTLFECENSLYAHGKLSALRRTKNQYTYVDGAFTFAKNDSKLLRVDQSTNPNSSVIKLPNAEQNEIIKTLHKGNESYYSKFNKNQYGVLMPIIEGSNLQNTKLNIDEKLAFIAFLETAYLHKKGHIHGDLKGDNILITKDGVLYFVDLELLSLAEELKVFKGFIPYLPSDWLINHIPGKEFIPTPWFDIYALTLMLLVLDKTYSQKTMIELKQRELIKAYLKYNKNSKKGKVKRTEKYQKMVVKLISEIEGQLTPSQPNEILNFIYDILKNGRAKTAVEILGDLLVTFPSLKQHVLDNMPDDKRTFDSNEGLINALLEHRYLNGQIFQLEIDKVNSTSSLGLSSSTEKDNFLAEPLAVTDIIDFAPIDFAPIDSAPIAPYFGFAYSHQICQKENKNLANGRRDNLSDPVIEDDGECTYLNDSRSEYLNQSEHKKPVHFDVAESSSAACIPYKFSLFAKNKKSSTVEPNSLAATGFGIV